MAEQPQARDGVCPNANHIAPEPVNGETTSCPCGRVTKIPARKE